VCAVEVKQAWKGMFIWDTKITIPRYSTLGGKGGKTRQITLPPVLAQSLQEFRGNAPASAPVFASASGRVVR
jgi:hypothetical protein